MTIISKCIDNINSFYKSFGVMVGLHGKLSKANEILEEGDRIVNAERYTSVDRLDSKLSNITRLASSLIASRKEQFFKEAHLLYPPSPGKRRTHVSRPPH